MEESSMAEQSLEGQPGDDDNALPAPLNAGDNKIEAADADIKSFD
jgi:hypothetical protein